MKEYKCKDCKYLDLTRKTSVGYVCTNEKRRTVDRGEISRIGVPINMIKPMAGKACKTGFEPRVASDD